MTSSTSDTSQQAAPPPGAALRVVGLDPSLRSFGAADAEQGSAPVLHCWKTTKTGHDRLEIMLSHVTNDVGSASLVMLEGLAYSRAGQAGHHDLAGLHWLIRHRLWEMDVPYVVVPPPVRIKWITGKGNSSKDQCLAAAIKRFPMADISGNDEADALTLAAMGLDMVGQPLVEMPKDRSSLLEKVEWGNGSAARQVP